MHCNCLAKVSPILADASVALLDFRPCACPLPPPVLLGSLASVPDFINRAWAQQQQGESRVLIEGTCFVLWCIFFSLRYSRSPILRNEDCYFRLRQRKPHSFSSHHFTLTFAPLKYSEIVRCRLFRPSLGVDTLRRLIECFWLHLQFSNDRAFAL